MQTLTACVLILIAAAAPAQSQTKTMVDYQTQIKNKPFVSVTDAPYRAKCDGVTNDTGAVTAALSAAVSLSSTLYVPGVCAVSSVAITTTSPVAIQCADPQAAGFVRVSTALQASTPLIKITNSTNVSVEGCYFNENGNGTNYTNAASSVWLTSVGKFTAHNNYCTLDQAQCFLYTGTGPVDFSHNRCVREWFACIAASGTGTVASPTYLVGFTATDNYCESTTYCILASVFVRDITISNNVGYHSGFALVQDTNRFVISGNTSYGNIDYGVGGATPTTVDCFFLEGVMDGIIEGNYANLCGKHAIFAQGSQLTVGTTEQLPTRRVKIKGNYATGINSQSCWAVTGNSFDNTQPGQNNSVEGNECENSLIGMTMTTTSDAFISNNHEYNLQVGGDTLASVTSFVYQNNYLHNVGVAVANTYSGVTITNSTLTGRASGNHIVNDGGSSLLTCWKDSVYSGGTATQIQLWPDNELTGCTNATVPVSTAPSIGTWPIGAKMASFSKTTGSAISWVNTSVSGAGVWQPTGYIGSGGVPTVSSCGTSSVAGGATNNRFAISLSGSPATCTVNFGTPQFDSAPFCSVQMYGTAITSYITAATLSQSGFGITFSAGPNGVFALVQCQ